MRRETQVGHVVPSMRPTGHAVCPGGCLAPPPVHMRIIAHDSDLDDSCCHRRQRNRCSWPQAVRRIGPAPANPASSGAALAPTAPTRHPCDNPRGNASYMAVTSRSVCRCLTPAALYLRPQNHAPKSTRVRRRRGRRPTAPRWLRARGPSRATQATPGCRGQRATPGGQRSAGTQG